jgi:hypothetical protein
MKKMCPYYWPLASWPTRKDRREEMRWNCVATHQAFAQHNYLKNCAKRPMKKRERGVWKVGKQIKGFATTILQWPSLPSLASSYNDMKVFFSRKNSSFFLVWFCFVLS